MLDFTGYPIQCTFKQDFTGYPIQCTFKQADCSMCGLGASMWGARLVKAGAFPLVDLSLVAIAMDEEELPVSVRLRRMPLCQRPPQVGAPVILAAPQAITRCHIIAPLLLSANLRWKIPGSPVILRAAQGSPTPTSSRHCWIVPICAGEWVL